MRVHEPNFAAEKGSRFRPLKKCLRAAVIGDRLIHQPCAVRKKQMFADEAQVLARLSLSEQAPDNALRHRQERVGETCLRIAWVEQKIGLAAFRPEYAIAGYPSVANKISVEVLAHRSRKRVERFRLARRALRSAE